MLTTNYQNFYERKPLKKKGKSNKKNEYFNYLDYLESSKKTFKQSGKLPIKSSYLLQLKDERWLEKRSKILKRDKHKCILCGSEHNLQVHHTEYQDGKKAWEYSNRKLITLCDECHKLVHQDMNHKYYPKYR